MEKAEEIIQHLGQIPWFQEVSPEHTRTIAEMACLRPVKAGEVLFREGDQADCVFIVLEGRIGLDVFVPHRGKIRLSTAERWEVFGWSSVTPTVHQRTAGATAVTDGLVTCIDAARLRAACEADHELGYLVMRRLANVVAGRLLVTRLQLLDMFAHPEAQND
jgi:CRP-like cAMP-binding protein